MCEAKVTINAELWKKILWDRARSYTFWKHLKNSTVIALSLYAGLMTVFFLTKNKALLFNPLWFFFAWLLLLSYSILRTYFSILFLKEEYGFYVKVDKNGVETEGSVKPWSDYLFYVEHEDYLEIHEKNKAISFLPKTDDLEELLEYTKANIAHKR